MENLQYSDIFFDLANDEVDVFFRDLVASVFRPTDCIRKWIRNGTSVAIEKQCGRKGIRAGYKTYVYTFRRFDFEIRCRVVAMGDRPMDPVETHARVTSVTPDTANARRAFAAWAQNAHIEEIQLSAREKHRRAWVEFLATRGANYAVTLAWNPHYGGTSYTAYRISACGARSVARAPSKDLGVPRLAGARHVSLGEVQKDVRQLHRDLDRQLFGTRFNLNPEELRTAFYGFVERPGSNLHVHLMWRVPPSRTKAFESIIRDKWRARNQYGSIDVQPIFDETGWAAYAAKTTADAWYSGDPELFLASPKAADQVVRSPTP